MCTDSTVLNKVTNSNRYPIPVIDELFDELQSSIVFKLHLRSVYYQIRIKKDDIAKTVFKTR